MPLMRRQTSRRSRIFGAWAPVSQLRQAFKFLKAGLLRLSDWKRAEARFLLAAWHCPPHHPCTQGALALRGTPGHRVYGLEVVPKSGFGVIKCGGKILGETSGLLIKSRGARDTPVRLPTPLLQERCQCNQRGVWKKEGPFAAVGARGRHEHTKPGVQPGEGGQGGGENGFSSHGEPEKRTRGTASASPRARAGRPAGGSGSRAREGEGCSRGRQGGRRQKLGRCPTPNPWGSRPRRDAGVPCRAQQAGTTLGCLGGCCCCCCRCPAAPPAPLFVSRVRPEPASARRRAGGGR